MLLRFKTQQIVSEHVLILLQFPARAIWKISADQPWSRWHGWGRVNGGSSSDLEQRYAGGRTRAASILPC